MTNAMRVRRWGIKLDVLNAAGSRGADVAEVNARLTAKGLPAMTLAEYLEPVPEDIFTAWVKAQQVAYRLVGEELAKILGVVPWGMSQRQLDAAAATVGLTFEQARAMARQEVHKQLGHTTTDTVVPFPGRPA